jgi:outer membrane protein, heavy metal efflux system
LHLGSKSSWGQARCLSYGVLGSLLLAGCARFQPQPLSPAETATRLEERSLTNAPLKAFLEDNLHRELREWPLASWDFDMLTLAAFYYQPSLSVARAQWAVARGGEVTAGQRPNPVLNVTPGYDTTTMVPSPWIPFATLDVPIETAGKRRYRRAQAVHLSEAARLNVASVAWQARSAVRSSLLDLIAATKREQLLQYQMALQQQIVQLLDQQVRAGAKSDSEALPFRIALAKSRVDLADAQRLRVESRTRLAEAIGVPAQALESISVSPGWLKLPGNLTELSSAEVRRAALQSRPDVLGALAEYAASESALQLEIARQFPDLRLMPGYQYDQGDNKWSLGITVDLPILNQNQGPIAEAKARRQHAAARFEAVQSKALAEIDRSIQVYQITERNSATVRGLTQEQAQRRDSIAAQVKAGATEQLDLVNAQFEYAVAEQAQLDAEVKLQQAFGALEDAVQRPFELPPAVFQSTQNHGP